MVAYVTLKIVVQDGYDVKEILQDAIYSVSYLDGNNQVIEDTEMVDILSPINSDFSHYFPNNLLDKS